MPPLTSQQKQQRRRARLDEVARQLGYRGESQLITAIINGEVRLERIMITNEHGVTIDFDAAVNLMDDELRERLHMELAPCSDQEFFDAYAAAHLEKYGQEFEPAKANPVW